MELSKYINGSKMAAVDKRSMMYEVSFYQNGTLTHITKAFTEEEAEALAENYVQGYGPQSFLTESIING
jgi:hypothetical protein